jgi:hypothetical protein
MDTFITVCTFSLPHEAQIAKLKLESEEISCMLKDELSVQVYNFASNAMGGVRLQVLEEDYDRAYQLLVSGGFIKEASTELNSFWAFIKKYTDQVILIRLLPLELRLALIVFILLLALLIPFFISQYSPGYQPIRSNYPYL